MQIIIIIIPVVGVGVFFLCVCWVYGCVVRFLCLFVRLFHWWVGGDSPIFRPERLACRSVGTSPEI